MFQFSSPHSSRPILSAVCAICVTGVMASGCFGWEEEVEEVTVNPVQPSEQDDTAPPETPFDPSLDYEGLYGAIENHSNQRFRFDVAAFSDEEERTRASKLYRSHADWFKAFGQHESYGATMTASVQTVGTYVKQLDDQIYAGIEIAVQKGLEPTYAPKMEILQQALDFLVQNRASSDDDEAIVYVATGLRLGGLSIAVPSELEAQVQQRISDFQDNDKAKSVPFGFYTWSEQLKQIWKQDRFLQTSPSTRGASCALAHAISADPVRKQRYAQLLDLYGRLTNPIKKSLRAALDDKGESCSLSVPTPFLSVSRSSEDELFAKLYPQGVPPDANLMDDLVKAIRDGSIDLKPKPDDGWYQHQIYALETLLVTDKSEERAKVAFMARYKKRLREAFETMLTQHRETHAKQVGSGEAIAEAPDPLPHFRVEPMATVYVRHARSYVFLENALDEVLGSEFLDQAVTVSEAGPGQQSVRDMIHHARDLFYGVYLVSCYDLGMHPKLDQAGDPPADSWKQLQEAAVEWLRGLDHDPIAQRDVRVIIPVANLGNHRFKYWAVLGVRSTLAGYSYISSNDVEPPKPIDQARIWLPTEQFAEVESSDVPLNRDEFRKLCDEKGSAEAIIEALQAR